MIKRYLVYDDNSRTFDILELDIDLVESFEILEEYTNYMEISDESKISLIDCMAKLKEEHNKILIDTSKPERVKEFEREADMGKIIMFWKDNQIAFKLNNSLSLSQNVTRKDLDADWQPVKEKVFCLENEGEKTQDTGSETVYRERFIIKAVKELKKELDRRIISNTANGICKEIIDEIFGSKLIGEKQ